jgi:hypothetical protein
LSNNSPNTCSQCLNSEGTRGSQVQGRAERRNFRAPLRGGRPSLRAEVPTGGEPHDGGAGAGGLGGSPVPQVGVTMQYFAKFSRHQEVRRGVLEFQGFTVLGFWSGLPASWHVAECSWALVRVLSGARPRVKRFERIRFVVDGTKVLCTEPVVAAPGSGGVLGLYASAYRALEVRIDEQSRWCWRRLRKVSRSV